MRSTALSVHGGRGDFPVDPAGGEDLVGVPGTGDTHFTQTIDIDAMFDVLSKVETTGGRVKKVKHLLVVDLQERTLAEKFN